MSLPYSQEVESILQYLRDQGVQFSYPTAGMVNEGRHVPSSYHYRDGTGGRGLAVDLSGGSGLTAIRNAFRRVGHTVELYGPGDPGHSDHIHVAVAKGTFLHRIANPVPKPKEGFMFDGETFIAQCGFVHKTYGPSVANVKKDGAVFCTPKESYLGGAFGKPWFKGPARKIKANKSGGYTVIGATDNDKYGFPVGASPD